MALPISVELDERLNDNAAVAFEPESPEQLLKNSEIRGIDEVLATGYRSLRFEPEAERRYQLDRHPVRRHFDFMVYVGALCCYLTFLIPDWLMIRDVFDLALRLRLMCTAGMVASFLVVQFVGPHLPALRQVFVVGVGLACAASILYLETKTQLPWAKFYVAGVIPVILFINTVSRVRFWFAVASSLLIVLMTLFVITRPGDMPMPVSVALSLLVVFSVVFTLYSNYQLEYDDRTTYLLRRRDQLQRERELLLLNRLGDLSRRYRELSLADALTGASNRRHLHEFLQELWRRLAKDDTEVSALLLDVDHFKAYNDTYGHPAGDHCLKQIAETIRSSLRNPEDVVARFGGEEFVVVLPEYSESRSAEIAERVRSAVQALAITHRASSVADVVTVSIGVAALRPSSTGASQEQLIAAADAALYLAKSGGRNQVRRASEINPANGNEQQHSIA